MITNDDFGRLDAALKSRTWYLTGGRVATKSSICMRARVTALRIEWGTLVFGLMRTDGDGDTLGVKMTESDLSFLDDPPRIVVTTLFACFDPKPAEEGGGWRSGMRADKSLIFSATQR